MRYKLIIIAFIINLLIITDLRANSIFSFKGFPIQDYNTDVLSLSMGGAGIGDTFRRNTSFINPSLSTTLNQVYFSTGISTGYYYYHDSSYKFRDDGIYFPYFNITIPLSNHRIGFNYSSYLSGNIDTYLKDKKWEEADLSFSEINRVRSYIYKGSLFWSYKHELVNLGLSFDYLLGHQFHSWKQEYVGAGFFIDPWYEVNRNYSNYGYSVGLNRSFGEVSLGALYSSPTNLEGDQEVVTRHKVFDIEQAKFETPHHLGLGLAWRLNYNYRIASDFHYELWSQTKSYEDSDNTYKFSLGLAYEPHWSYEKWHRRIPLRIGGYYRTLPFKVNDKNLDEIAASFGFTVPLQTPNSQLDFAIQYVVRGDVDLHDYSDESLILSIGFSGFDFFSSRKKKIDDRDIPEAEFESFRD